MSPALPEGDVPPDDGALPGSVLEGARERAFGVYLHVPFCAVVSFMALIQDSDPKASCVFVGDFNAHHQE